MGLHEDGNIHVGILPQREEILIGGFRSGLITRRKRCSENEGAGLLSFTRASQVLTASGKPKLAAQAAVKIDWHAARMFKLITFAESVSGSRANSD
jgi:hypothetical protein